MKSLMWFCVGVNVTSAMYTAINGHWMATTFNVAIAGMCALGALTQGGDATSRH